VRPLSCLAVAVEVKFVGYCARQCLVGMSSVVTDCMLHRFPMVSRTLPFGLADNCMVFQVLLIMLLLVGLMDGPRNLVLLNENIIQLLFSGR
jgi:hypothetical protein